MSKGPCTFRKSDLRRGVEALKSAGMNVERVEIDRAGRIILFPQNGGTAPKQQDLDPLDNWMAARAGATEGH
jgi:hypothetical protein